MKLRALAASLCLFAAIPFAHAAGTVTFCIEAAPEGFDMAQHEAGTTFDAVGITIYDQLMIIKPGSTELLPGLAESYTISPDGTQYTFKLRPNVKFHSTSYFKPTRDFNADDVLFSFQRMLDKKHWAHDAAPNGFNYWVSMGMPDLVKSIEKIDAMTVRFTLNRPESPFIATLAVPAVGPVLSAEYAEQLRAKNQLAQLNQLPIGTGPFAFRSYTKDAVLRMTSNAAYWGGAPKFDSLVLAITTDPDVAVQRVKAGECMVARIKNEAGAQFKGDPNTDVILNKPLQTLYVAPNNQRKITGDKRVREALWLAIDKPNYIRAAYNGSGEIAASFLPPDMWSYDKSLKNRSDLEQSKSLLKAAGYKGEELTMFVSEDTTLRRAAELLQADWARVGVNVRLQVMEQGEMFRRSGKGDHDLVLLRWGSDNADPDNFFTPNLGCAAVVGGGNKGRYCSKKLDEVLDAARRTPDMGKRTALYQQAQKIVYDDVAVIPLIYPVRTTVVSKRLSGYEPNPMDFHDFRNSSVK
ncbi:ABC transporter substrate-binding protein [soil metagenome]